MTDPVLTLFERDVWKRRSTTDSTQVAADYASISFYGQGATTSAASAEISVETLDPVIVDVYDRGDIETGDLIQRETATLEVMRVVGISGRTKITVVNASPVSFSLVKDKRLVRLTGRPAAYADPRGTQSLGSDIVDARGRFSVYVAAERFDYIVAGPGVTTAVYRDAMGGSRPNPSWVAVLDHHLDLQAAIDALPPSGGEIFLPSGTYVLPSTLLLNKDNVCLRGQGSNTILTARTNPDFDLVRIERRFCRLNDLAIDGNATSATAGMSCLVVTGAAAEQVFLKNLVLRRASKHGLEALNSGRVFGFNCESQDNYGNGFDLLSSSSAPLLVRLVACSARGNALAGVGIEGTGAAADGVTLLGCLVEAGIGVAMLNGLQLIGCRMQWTGIGVSAANLLDASEVRGLVVEGCWLDGQIAGAPDRALLGASIRYCPGAAFIGNVGTRLTNGLASIDYCNLAVEIGNRDLDSPATPRIFAPGSTLFGLSAGVVEPFRYATPPVVDATWRPGTMFSDEDGLHIVVDGNGTVKTVNLEPL